MGKLRWVAFAALFSLATACGQSNDRPKNQHVVSGGGSGGAGGGGGGSGGAPCTPDPTQGSTLSGNLITYDALFSDKKPFLGQGEIKAPGANCASVSTTWDGSTAGGPDGGPPLFLLESVESDPSLITHIYEVAGSGEPVYPTLLQIDSTTDPVVIDGFGLIRAQGIDEAYTATGTTRDPAKGTLLVQLVAPLSNMPQPNGKVDVSVNGAPAYPGLSGWQLGGETDASGVALMLNTIAKPYPGQTVKVNVTLGGQKDVFECPSESGAVSVCRIGIGVL